MAEYTALAPLFTDIANAIRSKTGETGAITANTFPEKINSLSLGTQFGIASKKSTEVTRYFTFETDFKPSNFMCILSPDRDYAIGLNSNSYRYIVSIFYQPSSSSYPYGCFVESTSSEGILTSIYYSHTSYVSISFMDTGIGLTSLTSGGVYFYGARHYAPYYYCVYWA